MTSVILDFYDRHPSAAIVSFSLSMMILPFLVFALVDPLL